jgi:hypothetical protein
MAQSWAVRQVSSALRQCNDAVVLQPSSYTDKAHSPDRQSSLVLQVARMHWDSPCTPEQAQTSPPTQSSSLAQA